MPTIYSSLYTNFIRQGSTFAKSIASHGYAQSVVAATHPHLLSSQNRPAFARHKSHRLSQLSSLHLQSAFHTERNGALGQLSDHRQANGHGGLDAYFEALQKQQAAGEVSEEDWTQFEFQKSIEWKPDVESVLEAEQTHASASLAAPDTAGNFATSTEEDIALAQIDAALEKEIAAARTASQDAESGADLVSEAVAPSDTRTPADGVLLTPTAIARSRTPVADPQSQSYADHLGKLSAGGRYAEIPAVFEAMLATGVKPIASAYNALLMAALHIPSQKTEIVSKALDVYADMLRRRVTPDGDTFDILVGLLASRSLEVSAMMTALEEKRSRFGGIDQPGKFMLASHELEHAILGEDNRLDLAIKLFEVSVTLHAAAYSAETYHQMISACARAGRVSDMLRLFEHMESHKVVPFAAVFPPMITAFASCRDLVSAVECYNEYRNLAIANDGGKESIHDRLDAPVYAAVINAYVITDKIEGAMKFFERITREYGVRANVIKEALISAGFVKGFMARGIYDEALQWAQSVESSTRADDLARVTTVAADNGNKSVATAAYQSLPSSYDHIAEPAMAMLALSVREGDIAAATEYWHTLTRPDIRPSKSFIEPTAMYAVALLGSGQVAEGLTQSDMMFQRIFATEAGVGVQLSGEIEEGIEFIQTYMKARGITDPRTSSPASTFPSETVTASPYSTEPTVSSAEETFDPYAHNTDFRGSSLITDDLEGAHGRRGPQLGDAMNRFKNMRRTGRHPRYITYAKLISAAAREGQMDLCSEVLAMARTDVPLMPQYAVVRYGWTSILDAMVGACLNLGNRGRAEQFHQELLEIGSAPSANTYGLYITTLKESAKTFDEASEAVRIFHRAKSEGVEPSSFLYNALIGKLGKARRIDDCLFYFAEMRALGIKPTSVTYGTIVNALCRVSDEKFAEELFNEMEAMPNYKARPAPYNSMMQFFLTTKRDKAKVLSYYERMRARNITPTAHTFKLLVDTYATLEPVDMKAAEKVLDEIRASGQALEPVHFASLIHARGCVLHDVSGARELFDRVVREDQVPSHASLYQALLESMVANHDVAETDSILEHMRRNKVAMTPYIANTLIHGWASEKNIIKAEDVYGSLGRDKREPSTYEAMTRAYLAVEQRERAEGVVNEMLGRGYPNAVVHKVLELLGGGPTATTE